MKFRAMKWLWLVLIALLMVPVLPVLAQDTPVEIREAAISDVNRVVPGIGRPTSWEHVLITATNSNLGCNSVAGTPLSGPVTVYVVTLTYPNAVYTYHVSNGGATVIACGATSLTGSGGGQITTGPTTTTSTGTTNVTNPANPNVNYVTATCPAGFTGYATPRLFVGALGQVEAGGVNNIIRQNYGRSSQPTGSEMPPGSTFTVIGGPECTGASLNEAILWWQVSYNGTTGWTAESLNGTYFLQLIGTAPVQPTLSAAPTGGTLSGKTLAGSVLPPSLTLPSVPRNAISVANIAQIRPLNAEMTFPDVIERMTVTTTGQVSIYVHGMTGANSALFYNSVTTPQFTNAGEQLLTSTQIYWGMNPTGANYVVADYPTNVSIPTISLVDRATGAAKVITNQSSPLEVVFSPSGKYIAFIFNSSGGTNLSVYNIAAGTLNPVNVTSPVVDAAFSGDDSVLVTVNALGEVFYWNPETFFNIGPALTGLQGYTLNIGINAAGTLMAVGGESGVVQLWNVNSNTKLFDLPVFAANAQQPGDINALAFSPDGTLLATGKVGLPLGNNVLVFNTTNGQQIATLQGMQAVLGLQFSSSGDLLVGHDDLALHFWSVTP